MEKDINTAVYNRGYKIEGKSSMLGWDNHPSSDEGLKAIADEKKERNKKTEASAMTKAKAEAEKKAAEVGGKGLKVT